MLLILLLVFCFFKQKTAYEMLRSLVGSEMCIRDSVRRRGLDPSADPLAVRRLVDEVITDCDERTLSSSLPRLPDPRSPLVRCTTPWPASVHCSVIWTTPGSRRSGSTSRAGSSWPVSYTHLRAHETPEHLVCRLLLEKK